MKKRIKGEPRRKNEDQRKLRAMAARIPDQATLDGFIAGLPSEQQTATYELLAPHTRFKTR